MFPIEIFHYLRWFDLLGWDLISWCLAFVTCLTKFISQEQNVVFFQSAGSIQHLSVYMKISCIKGQILIYLFTRHVYKRYLSKDQSDMMHVHTCNIFTTLISSPQPKSHKVSWLYSSIRFWGRYNQNCGCHGNRESSHSLIMGENNVPMLVTSLLIQSLSNLQVTRTGINHKFKFPPDRTIHYEVIRPWPLKNLPPPPPHWLIMEKMLSPQ